MMKIAEKVVMSDISARGIHFAFYLPLLLPSLHQKVNYKMLCKQHFSSVYTMFSQKDEEMFILFSSELEENLKLGGKTKYRKLFF